MRLIVIALSLLFHTVSGQEISTISSDHLKEDLKILKTTLIELHPDIYRYTPKEKFEQIVDSVERSLGSDLTVIEFYRLAARVVTSIRNGHTIIKPSENFLDQRKLLPLRLIEFDKSVFIQDDFSSTDNRLRGLQITRINGVPVGEIVRQIIPYISMDGFNRDARYKAALEDDLSYYYNLIIGQPKEFVLQLYDAAGKSVTEVLSGIEATEYWAKYSGTNDFPWNFYGIDSLNSAYLKIESFSNLAFSKGTKTTFRSFIKASFAELQKTNMKRLVIDLRNNGGGELKNAILLYSYITNKPFKFAKSVEIATIDKPTYLEYTDYERAVRFDRINSKRTKRKNGKIYLKDHFSLVETKPNKKKFTGELIVMINEQTGSAAGAFTSQIKSNKRGLIAGRENRDNFTGFSAGVPVTLTLPNTGMQVYIPLRKFEYAIGTDNGRGVIPDFKLSSNSKDYFEGVGTELNFVLNLFR